MPREELRRQPGAIAQVVMLAASDWDAERIHAYAERLSGRMALDRTAVILMPLDQRAPPVSDVAALFPDMDVEQVSHRTPLLAGQVHLLPPGRRLVLEDGLFCLRPLDRAAQGQPQDGLTPALAAQYGAHFHLLTEGPDPAAAMMRATVKAAGGMVEDGAIAASAANTGAATSFTAPSAQPSDPYPRSLPHGAGAVSVHDLRQPLQTLVLLQSLLRRHVTDERGRTVLERMEETLGQMTAMLHGPPVPLLRVPASSVAATSFVAADHDRVTLGNPGERPQVHVIDDDSAIRAVMRELLEQEGCAVHDYERCEDFIAAYDGEINGCVLVDAYLPGMSGLELLAYLKREGHAIPAVMMTGSSDVQMAVQAMKTGARDFIEKPVSAAALLDCVRQALERARSSEAETANREQAAQALKGLTRRQRQIMSMVLDGHPSKNIAADLGISQRTVENHRAAIMKKTGARSLPALARLALAQPSAEN